MTKRLLHRYPKSGEDDNWTGKNLIESTLGDMKHLIKVDNTTCNRTRSVSTANMVVQLNI